MGFLGKALVARVVGGASAAGTSADTAVNSNGNASNLSNSRLGPLGRVNLIAPRPKKRMDTLLIF